MIEATILAPERVRLRDGVEFTGQNAEGDAARWLIGHCYAPETPMHFVWHDGRPSSSGTINAYARRYHSDSTGMRKWQPHPRGEYPVSLLQWAAKLAGEPARRPGGRRAA